MIIVDLPIMYKKIFIVIIFILGVFVSNAQNYWVDSVYLLQGRIQGTDTIPNVNVKEVKVFPKKVFKNKRQRRRYTRLMYNVRKAYPFAIIARNELKLMNDSLIFITDEKERKKFIKEYEKQMFWKYETKLRRLTFSQGKILIKLVYREMGNTSYELVKEYRGSFSAVFWQGVARLFGSDLKSTYDPKGEDKDVERIVQMIEAGVL